MGTFGLVPFARLEDSKYCVVINQVQVSVPTTRTMPNLWAPWSAALQWNSQIWDVMIMVAMPSLRGDSSQDQISPEKESYGEFSCLR